MQHLQTLGSVDPHSVARPLLAHGVVDCELPKPATGGLGDLLEARISVEAGLVRGLVDELLSEVESVLLLLFRDFGGFPGLREERKGVFGAEVEASEVLFVLAVGAVPDLDVRCGVVQALDALF